MPKLSPTLILFALLLSFPFEGHANNLSISNVRVTDSDSSAGTALIEFDISWDNSWRDSVNHDAVWIFFKYSFSVIVLGPGKLAHGGVVLNASGTNPTGFSTGSGTPIDIIVPSDKRGCFIQRKHLGSGTVTVTDVQVVWPWSVHEDGNGLALTDPGGVVAYGIEMVYIPTGGFHAGDGNTGATNAEFEYGSSSSLPAPVNSEDGISFSNVSAGGWYYNSGSNTVEYASGSVFNVSSSYPKGYQAFYMMKYELSQDQYVAFLNKLSRHQQMNRVQSGVSGNTVANYFVMSNTTFSSERNTITCPSTGNGSSGPISFSASSSIGTGRGNRACNYLSWMDLAAYADWAALRPMTELEFEKAARGPIYPVTNEYAWGSTSITQAATISGTEDGTEYITTASANACYGGTTFSGGDASTGPLRCGIFATSTTDTRQATGAGYYGAMELSGNVAELVVSMGNSAGISFSGTHGDSVLTNVTGTSYDGNATNIDWPGLDSTDISRGITGGTGSGDRGSGWNQANTKLYTSRRATAAYINSTRTSEIGGRLVRTAP